MDPNGRLPAGPVRWGILGTGKIAHSFARDLALLPDARLVAVAARREVSARAFAAEFPDRTAGPARAYGGYPALAADPEVDVVYVATPHGLHHEQVTMLLHAGKPVLCEKALTLNAAQAEDLIALAGERGLFLMEAMWMACHPLIRLLADRMRSGEFGVPRQLTADLGWLVQAPPTDRLLAPELGGGALLDMGIYPLTLAQLLLGEPLRQTALAVLSESGVDLNVAIAAQYAHGAVAALTTTMTGHSGRTAALSTDAGRVDFPAPFHHPGHLTWTPYRDGKPQRPMRIDPPEPVIGSGLGNEAAEVQRCLRAGLLQSPLVPHAQTLAVLRQLDGLRAQLGVVYPDERR